MSMVRAWKRCFCKGKSIAGWLCFSFFTLLEIAPYKAKSKAVSASGQFWHYKKRKNWFYEISLQRFMITPAITR